MHISPRHLLSALLGCGMLLALGCSGTPAAVPPVTPEESAFLPVPGSDFAAAPREVETPDRGATANDLTGKWFGKLVNFDPAEPPLNSWQIDLDLVQEGHDIHGVVIMSELIPIAVNIWDVFIRLDATTHGSWNAGEAHLNMFQDVKSGVAPGSGVVVNPSFPKSREMEYVEAVITGIEDNELQGHLVIHWRNPYDLQAGWTQVCHFSHVSPVAQGNGGGGD